MLTSESMKTIDQFSNDDEYIFIKRCTIWKDREAVVTSYIIGIIVSWYIYDMIWYLWYMMMGFEVWMGFESILVIFDDGFWSVNEVLYPSWWYMMMGFEVWMGFCIHLGDIRWWALKCEWGFVSILVIYDDGLWSVNGFCIHLGDIWWWVLKCEWGFVSVLWPFKI